MTIKANKRKRPAASTSGCIVLRGTVSNRALPAKLNTGRERRALGATPSAAHIQRRIRSSISHFIRDSALHPPPGKSKIANLISDFVGES